MIPWVNEGMAQEDVWTRAMAFVPDDKMAKELTNNQIFEAFITHGVEYICVNPYFNYKGKNMFSEEAITNLRQQGFTEGTPLFGIDDEGAYRQWGGVWYLTKTMWYKQQQKLFKKDVDKKIEADV